MIICKIVGSRSGVLNALIKEVEKSRFTANIDEDFHARHRDCIKISMVRLRERKHFCGNHPNECVGVGERHKKAKFLEGADWVEFNDLVNDTLDALDVSANVFSRPLELKSPLWIRRGALRRLEYNSQSIHDPVRGTLLGHVWLSGSLQEEPFADHRGRIAPRSYFPDGTPGIYQPTGYSSVGHSDHQH